MTQRLTLVVLTVCLFHFVHANASTVAGANALERGSHALRLNVVQSGSEGASFSAASEAGARGTLNPLQDEQSRPFGAGVLWALPMRTSAVRVVIESAQWRDVTDGEISDSVVQVVLNSPLPVVQTSAVLRMRGIPLTTIAINGLQPSESGNGVRICESLEFSLEYDSDGEQVRPGLISPVMLETLRDVAANLDNVAPAPVVRPEPYLIITRPVYVGTGLNNFVQWKRDKGHTVTVATTDETGTTTNAIRNFIRSAYETWEEPPLFVLFIGDEDGANGIPAYTIQGFYTATDVTDHIYSLLDGEDDWFPDVLVGRFSVDTESELQTVFNKNIQYESQPFEPTGAWRSRMLITGVRSTPGFYQTYNTAWPTLQWIGREALQAGYAAIDSVPYPPGTASQINQKVNSGVSFVAYRGFGSPSDWAYPHYTNGDVGALTNGAMLPLVMSIVCGGGAFDSEVDPCFGEVWLRGGTPSNFKGAIAFMGPSELDTKTRWNNTIIAGTFDGIFNANVNCAGAALLRGKMELIRQFPNNVDIITSDSDRSPWFYFHIYNLLGDPGLNFFVGNVRDLTVVAPESVSVGSETLTLAVTEEGQALPGAWGTLKQNGTIISHAISNDHGILNFELTEIGAGTIHATVTKPRHEPALESIVVGSQQFDVAPIDVSYTDSQGNQDGIANPRERITYHFRTRNFGTLPFGGGNLVVSSADGFVQMVDSSLILTSLAPGAQSEILTVSFDLSGAVPDGATAVLRWNIGAGDYISYSSLPVVAARLMVTSVLTGGVELNPEPDAESSVQLVLSNIGSSSHAPESAGLRSLDNRVTVTGGSVQYAAIAPGETVTPTGSFTIQCGDFYPGDWAQVELFFGAGDEETTIPFLLPIGNQTPGDPTHPDSYGYRAFDDGDDGYIGAPNFGWFEVDPALGGSGTIVNIGDTGEGRDASATVTLPFNFSFYGISYNQISVCSNGFIAFGGSGESFLRNYELPAIASPDNMIAAFWDDLSIPTGGHVCTYHDAVGGRFVIEWSRLQNEYGTHPEETFQIVLHDTECWPTRTGDGDILVQYLNISNSDAWDNYATVGLQSKSAGSHLLVSYANLNQPGVNPIRSNQCILYTTGRPDGGAYVGFQSAVIDDDQEGGSNGNSDGIAQNGELIELAFSLFNSGDGASPASTGTLTTSDSRMTILDAQMSFPSIPAGGSAQGSAVRVQISPSTPNGYVAGFLLQLSGGALPCVVIPTLTVSAPLLIGGPVVMDDDSIAPSIGNGNGEVNPLETIELIPSASNAGGNAASSVTAILRRLNNLVTLLDSTVTIGDVPIGESRTAGSSFVFRLNNNADDGDQVGLRIVFRDTYGNEWIQNVSYLVGSPALEAAGLRAVDPAPDGNGDGFVNPGETVGVFPLVRNTGLGSADGVTVTLTTDDPDLTIENATQVIGQVGGQSSREPTTPVTFQINASTLYPRSAHILMTIVAEGGFEVSTQVSLIIGSAIYVADFESELDRWTIFGRNGEWHLQTREYASADHAYYCGQEGSRQYRSRGDEYLRSPSFVFNGHGSLIFSTRYETEPSMDICRVQLQRGSSTYDLLGSFSGSHLEWHQVEYSLEGLPAAESAKIRFWFESDLFGNQEGWYIDNVVIVNETFAIDELPNTAIPETFSLEQNFPNPFNDETTIVYNVPRTSPVKLTLYDVQGRTAVTLLDQMREPGSYSLSWKPLSLASGIYFVRLEAGSFSMSRKLLYLK